MIKLYRRGERPLYYNSWNCQGVYWSKNPLKLGLKRF